MPASKVASIVCAILVLACAPSVGMASQALPTRVLIVGGGPEAKYNQVAIESNVRYILRLLPKASPRRVLFASGRVGDRNVYYEDSAGNVHMRASTLKHVDGPANEFGVTKGVGWLRANPAQPELLIFTGHGSYDRTGLYRDNWYDLWGEEEFHVSDLAADLATAPANVPITLVMTQCFSGGFMNAMFEGADPNGKPVKQDFCGFFATIPNWMSAGCTPDINEKNYRDFAGYFFAALSGVDRDGKPVTGADYNGDGVVGMDEAFDYTIGHDESIDTPTCTSDIFLRRFIASDDAVIFKTTYADILAWATPGQKSALGLLAASLNLRGDDCLSRAYDQFSRVAAEDPDDPTVTDAKYIRFVRLAKTVYLEHRMSVSADSAVKTRFAALQRAEARNPLR